MTLPVKICALHGNLTSARNEMNSHFFDCFQLIPSPRMHYPPAACSASVQRSSPRTSCALCCGFTCGQLTRSPPFFSRFPASNLEKKETTHGSESDPFGSTPILPGLVPGRAWISSLCFKLGCVNQKPTMASRSTPTIPREKIEPSPH